MRTCALAIALVLLVASALIGSRVSLRFSSNLLLTARWGGLVCGALLASLAARKLRLLAILGCCVACLGSGYLLLAFLQEPGPVRYIFSNDDHRLVWNGIVLFSTLTSGISICASLVLCGGKEHHDSDPPTSGGPD